MIITLVSLALLVILIIIIVSKYNHAKLLSNEVHSLNADINTALGLRRDLTLRGRILTKDFQEHELRMAQTKGSDTHLIMPTNALGAAPIIANGQNDTKANESQQKVQMDLNQVEEYLHTKIEFQHKAVKSLQNYLSTFPNLLLSPYLNLGEVKYFTFDNDRSLYEIETTIGAAPVVEISSRLNSEHQGLNQAPNE